MTTKFGNMELTDDGILRVGASPSEISHIMEQVSKQLVLMAAAAGQQIDLDKYMPELKKRVEGHIFSGTSDIREIVVGMAEDKNMPEAVTKFDAQVTAGRDNFSLHYDDVFSDLQPLKHLQARSVFEKINAILALSAADPKLNEERQFLKAV